MRYNTWTILSILSLISRVISRSISGESSRPMSTTPTDSYHQQQVELLKQRLRDSATQRTVYNSIPHLNRTIEEQRRMLREYREKLRELNELDEKMDLHEQTVHKRNLDSYVSTENGADIGRYYFPVDIAQPNDHKKETKVQSAMLKLHRQSNLQPSMPQADAITNSTKRNVGYNTVLLVYQTLPGNMRRLVTSKVISLARSDWIKIDVTEIAQNWVDEPGMNLGIELECTSHNISQVITKSTDNSLKPSLDILTYERSINVRRKRRQAATQESCIPGTCCKQSVEITYRDAGIHDDFIHEENASFTAYYCKGGCPSGHLLRTAWGRTKNTILKYSSASRYKNRCAPHSFTDFEYLSFNEHGHPVMTTVDDLIVEQCACT